MSSAKITCTIFHVLLCHLALTLINADIMTRSSLEGAVALKQPQAFRATESESCETDIDCPVDLICDLNLCVPEIQKDNAGNECTSNLECKVGFICHSATGQCVKIPTAKYGQACQDKIGIKPYISPDLFSVVNMGKYWIFQNLLKTSFFCLAVELEIQL